MSSFVVLNVIVLAFVSSGRELFMADASVFIDDAEAYEVYERCDESQASEEQVEFRLTKISSSIH
jgi:hypothetical protein